MITTKERKKPLKTPAASAAVTEWQTGTDLDPVEWPLKSGSYRGKASDYKFVKRLDKHLFVFDEGGESAGDLDLFVHRAGDPPAHWHLRVDGFTGGFEFARTYHGEDYSHLSR